MRLISFTCTPLHPLEIRNPLHSIYRQFMAYWAQDAIRHAALDSIRVLAAGLCVIYTNPHTHARKRNAPENVVVFVRKLSARYAALRRAHAAASHYIYIKYAGKSAQPRCVYVWPMFPKYLCLIFPEQLTSSATKCICETIYRSERLSNGAVPKRPWRPH